MKIQNAHEVLISIFKPAIFMNFLQRLFVEMEQMASRPFSQVLVEIERREKAVDNGSIEADVNHTSVGKRKKVLRQV